MRPPTPSTIRRRRFGLEPLYAPFWEAVVAERAELGEARYGPWTEIVDPEPLAELFQTAGVTTPTITSGSHPTVVDSSGDWWAIVMGSGLRGVVDKLTLEQAGRVERANAEIVESMAPLSLRADVLYAVATKPSWAPAASGPGHGCRSPGRAVRPTYATWRRYATLPAAEPPAMSDLETDGRNDRLVSVRRT